MQFLLFIVLIISIFSCNQPNPYSHLEDAPEARLIAAEKIISPEQRDIENKIAARTLLQKVIDESEKFQRTEYSYECSNHAGGILTFIKEAETLQGIRFAAAQSGQNEFLSFYYKNDELVFVAQELGQAYGEQETATQTLFYLDKEKIIRCMQKSVTGAKEQLERLIQELEFKMITTPDNLWQKIKTQEDLFKNKITSKNIAAHLCK